MAPKTVQKAMSKSQIVNHFAEQLEIPRKDAANFIEQYTTMAIKEVKKNGSFAIPGIGKLVKVQRKARMGRNPATGESIKIPAKTSVKMRVSKACKESIL